MLQDGHNGSFAGEIFLLALHNLDTGNSSTSTATRSIVLLATYASSHFLARPAVDPAPGASKLCTSHYYHATTIEYYLGSFQMVTIINCNDFVIPSSTTPSSNTILLV
jgi:hypothetical protein